MRPAVTAHEAGAWIVERAPVHIRELRGRLDHFWRNLDDVDRRGWMHQHRRERDTAAESHDRDPPRIRMQQERHMGEELLREHVAPGRRVHLAVDRERALPSERLHRNRSRGALAVIEKRSRSQRGTTIDAGWHESRIQITACRQPLSIPARAGRHPHDQCADRNERRDPAAVRMTAAEGQRDRTEQHRHCGNEQ